MDFNRLAIRVCPGVEISSDVCTGQTLDVIRLLFKFNDVMFGLLVLPLCISI
jgi:hypothetical protein